MSAGNDFLLGGGSPAAQFEAIGDDITGTVLSTEVKQQTDIQTGDPLTWPNGDPRMQLIVRLQTDIRNIGDPDDDGIRALYVKGSKKSGSRSLHDAVASAVRASGAKGLEEGGTLTVVHDGTEPARTRGFNDRKLYRASYKPPTVAAANEFLGAGQPVAPAAPSQSVPAPPTAEQIAAFEAYQTAQAAKAAADKARPPY